MIGALVGVFSGDIGKHWGNMYISTVFVSFVYSRGGGPIARKILGGRAKSGWKLLRDKELGFGNFSGNEKFRAKTPWRKEEVL
jgi:hypothetical protein